MGDGTKLVYDFREGSREMRDLLGGKGANVAEMTRILGAERVPAGFTITTEACVDYMRSGWPEGLDDQVAGEVLAPPQVVLAERRRRLARLLQGVRGELVGQVVGADDGQRVDARLPAWPEDLDDDAFAAILGRRKPQHLEDDLVVRLRPLGAGVTHSASSVGGRSGARA